MFEHSETLGFVPTMGALHEGHLQLLDQAIGQNDHSICSIFVNPTQFNNSNDLDKYPRQEEADLAKLEARGCSFVFIPSTHEMYPDEVKSESFSFDGLENEMEGAFRPGHFDGVGTIVGRLFDLVRPTRAYFGEKDFQQLRIIQKMVEMQKREIEIVPCPIVRESTGLAMSSRNERLSTDARKDATILHEMLNSIKQDFDSGVNWDQARKKALDLWSTSHNYSVEYLTLNKVGNLKALDEWDRSDKMRVFIAAEIEGVRLIDNLSIN